MSFWSTRPSSKCERPARRDLCPVREHSFGNLLDVLEFAHLGRFLAPDVEPRGQPAGNRPLSENLGRENVYQLPTTASSPGRDGKAVKHLSGRLLFGPDRTYESLEKALEDGAVVKVTPLTKEFDYEAFHAHYEGQAWPLFLIEDDRLHVWAVDIALSPRAGHAVVSLVPSALTKAVPQPAAG